MDMLIGDGKTIILTINVGLSYKIIFVSVCSNLLYASEVDCEELEPESRSITDICTKIQVALERLVAS